MTVRSPVFWRVLQVLALAIYSLVIQCLLAGEPTHPLVIVALILLVVHLLEIPHAMSLLRDRSLPRSLLVGATLVFGILWWYPVRQGILQS